MKKICRADSSRAQLKFASIICSTVTLSGILLRRSNKTKKQLQLRYDKIRWRRCQSGDVKNSGPAQGADAGATLFSPLQEHFSRCLPRRTEQRSEHWTIRRTARTTTTRSYLPFEFRFSGTCFDPPPPCSINVSSSEDRVWEAAVVSTSCPHLLPLTVHHYFTANCLHPASPPSLTLSPWLPPRPLKNPSPLLSSDPHPPS